MSNTSKGKADKGSKYWMQEIVNNKFLRKEIASKLGERSLDWISPLEKDSYSEYRFNDKDLQDKIPEISEGDFSFWPSQGPRWDAIALSKSGEKLYLFEAKSHIDEMVTGTDAKEGGSGEKRIKKSMEIACKNLFPKKIYDNDTESLWKDVYFQMGNRLTFLYYMNNKMEFSKIKNVKLVLLNVVDDITHNKSLRTKLDKWTKHYEEVFEKMTGSKETPKDVIMLYFHCGFC